MNIQLPTGKTMTMTCYEWLFILKEDQIDEFYQAAIADDLGTELMNPFSNKASMGKIEFEEPDDLEDILNI